MKKILTNLLAIAIIAMISVFTGCKKPDTTAPEITLKGAANQTISLQGIYTELGATATDNKDGAITPIKSGTVNVNHTGTYIITYTATDAVGNVSKATRTITVVNDVASMTGHYTCTGSTAYTGTITASPVVNKRINFSLFGNYAGNANIFAHVAGTTVGSVVTLDTVLSIQVGTPPKDRIFQGTGSVTSSAVFTLHGTEIINGGAPINFNETFQKQ